jgi:hypothetical protein
MQTKTFKLAVGDVWTDEDGAVEVTVTRTDPRTYRAFCETEGGYCIAYDGEGNRLMGHGPNHLTTCLRKNVVRRAPKKPRLATRYKK